MFRFFESIGKYTLLMWTPTAGIALKWFKNQFCENFSFRELDELAKDLPAGSDGLTFLPYLCGATMPRYNPDARGVFWGLTMEHTRGHAVRSILEAVACMLKSNLDYIGAECDEVRTMGGGAQSPLWCQIKADMTGKTFVTLKNDETACLGSAILAGVATGVFESVEAACKIDDALRFFNTLGIVRLDFKAVTSHITAKRGDHHALFGKEGFVLRLFLSSESPGRKLTVSRIYLNARKAKACGNFNTLKVSLVKAICNYTYFHSYLH